MTNIIMVQLHYLVSSPVLFYICVYLYVWPISVDLGEEKAFPSNFSVVWLEHTLSCCCTSVRNKSVKGFHKAKYPSLSFVSHEHMRASLSYNKIFLELSLV